MKVGDYVRTKYGNIGKITNLNKQFSQVEYQDNQTRCDTNESNILKSSPNIIDLIEVGDLVKIENEGWVQVSIKFEVLKFFDNSGTEYLYEEIEAIITKEQIESMEYKVKE